MHLLGVVVQLQVRSGVDLPLLVDENIHYRIMRLMYSPGTNHVDLCEHVRQVPVLFGVWHAYKHTVTLVYRAFFALLANLESSRQPVAGTRVFHRCKVLYMEKLFAVLLVARGVVQPDLLRALTGAQSEARYLRNYAAQA